MELPFIHKLLELAKKSSGYPVVHCWSHEANKAYLKNYFHQADTCAI